MLQGPFYILKKFLAINHYNRLLVCLNSKFDELKEFDQVLIEKQRTNFLQCLESFSNVKQTLKKVGLNSCKTDVLHNCNRLLIGLNLNFDLILTYQRSYFTESYTPFVLHLEFFLKFEIVLKRSKALFMKKECLVLL